MKTRTPSGLLGLGRLVIAPILGGRVVDTFKAFSANVEGLNGELLSGEL